MSDVKEEVLEKEEAEETEEQAEDISSAIAAMMAGPPEPRVIGIFGDIDEERSANACAALITFQKMANEPIELFISTNGGAADEMYAIVDTIRYVQGLGCEVHVVGVGKVMSAGVLILASGTKGKRKIGKHARLMLHPIQGGIAGSFVDMKDDISIMQKMQEKYIKSLTEVSNLSHRQIKRIVNKRFDSYFTADEALDMGLVDEIL